MTGRKNPDGALWMLHETAIISAVGEPQIGDGTRIWAFSHISQEAVLGKNVMIGEGVHVGPRMKIGNGCKIQNSAQIFEGVTLEDDVFIGPCATFTNVLTPRAFQKASEYKPTLVKRGASIGANATILCGITIGEYAMIGAGAVVTKDVKPYTLVVGNPSRQTGWVCRCGRRIYPPSRRGHETEVVGLCSGCKTEITCIYNTLWPYDAIDVRIANAAP